MGDRLGIPGAVDFCLAHLHQSLPVSARIFSKPRPVTHTQLRYSCFFFSYSLTYSFHSLVLVNYIYTSAAAAPELVQCMGYSSRLAFGSRSRRFDSTPSTVIFTHHIPHQPSATSDHWSSAHPLATAPSSFIARCSQLSLYIAIPRREGERVQQRASGSAAELTQRSGRSFTCARTVSASRSAT